MKLMYLLVVLAGMLSVVAAADGQLKRTLEIRGTVEESCDDVDGTYVVGMRQDLAGAFFDDVNATESVSVFFPECGAASLSTRIKMLTVPSMKVLSEKTDILVQVVFANLAEAEAAREGVDDGGIRSQFKFRISNIETFIVGKKDSSSNDATAIIIVAIVVFFVAVPLIYFLLGKCSDSSPTHYTGGSSRGNRDVELGAEVEPEPAPPAAKQSNADNAVSEENLPPGWRVIANDGDPYYWHDERMESSWTMPTE